MNMLREVESEANRVRLCRAIVGANLVVPLRKGMEITEISKLAIENFEITDRLGETDSYAVFTELSALHVWKLGHWASVVLPAVDFLERLLKTNFVTLWINPNNEMSRAIYRYEIEILWHQLQQSQRLN